MLAYEQTKTKALEIEIPESFTYCVFKKLKIYVNRILERFGLEPKKSDLKEWKGLVKN
ncbi:hypothetical protein KKH26_01865 [Patescibacteria group bacterium]|nr:hypothetical protein [Patescibacteria group bacterium]